jgi:hypothetical protein
MGALQQTRLRLGLHKGRGVAREYGSLLYDGQVPGTLIKSLASITSSN